MSIIGHRGDAVNPLRSVCPSVLLLAIGACGVTTSTQSTPDSGDETGASGDGNTGAPVDAEDGGDDGSDANGGGSSGNGNGSGESNDCTALLDDIGTHFADAKDLVPCDESVPGAKIAASLMNLSGLTIDNEGVRLTPCVAARCDATWAYIATNALPHYDFVPMTPNPLVEVPVVYRIPLVPTDVPSQAGVDAANIDGCADAYDQFLLNAEQATTREPSELCSLTRAAEYLSDPKGAETVTYQKVQCLDITAFVSSGSPIFGPNEAAMPDPYGNPGFNYPLVYGGSYGRGASLDYCGGHTASTMHYHAVKDACFDRDAAGQPARSYDEATSDFNQADALTLPCEQESGIVGWALDGYPIKGSCVCTKRGGDGACTELRRARSGWIYEGLARWGSDAGEAAALGNDGKVCNSDADCCTGANCHLRCASSLFADAGASEGVVADQRCVTVDYSWCTSRYLAQTDPAPAGSDFVYLDRCNGFEGPDGFSYHSTSTFPLLVGCYRGQVDRAAQVAMAPGGGGGGGGGTTGGGANTGGQNGGNPPACAPGQTMMCCGDGFCGGPETAANCPADC